MRRAQQIETEGIKLLDVLKHKSFADGYISVAQGEPFDADFGIDHREAWFYERGRAVATSLAAAKGRVPPLWVDSDLGSAINPAVISAAAKGML